MSVTELEMQVCQLPPRERLDFLAWVDEHRAELAGRAPVSDEVVARETPLDDAQQREVLRRLAEAESQPALLEPFEKADLETMIGEILHAHAQKAQARPL